MDMTTWNSQMNAIQYYDRLGYACPRCSNWLSLQESAMVVLGSDFLLDNCFSCGIKIIVDSRASDTIQIHGFADDIQFLQKVDEFTKQGVQRPEVSPSQTKGTNKQWWNIWS